MNDFIFVGLILILLPYGGMKIGVVGHYCGLAFRIKITEKALTEMCNKILKSEKEGESFKLSKYGQFYKGNFWLFLRNSDAMYYHGVVFFDFEYTPFSGHGGVLYFPGDYYAKLALEPDMINENNNNEFTHLFGPWYAYSMPDW